MSAFVRSGQPSPEKDRIRRFSTGDGAGRIPEPAVEPDVRRGGELGATSRGAVHIKGVGRNTFQVTAWEPPVHWEWIGRFPGLRVYYDHRFEPKGPTSTRMEWLVTLRGPVAPLIRGVFAGV